ncbi:MAG: Hpt domain-containing protein [Salinivenus sp.]
MPPSPLDRSALFQTVDGDVDFLKTLVQTFLDDCPAYLAALQAAADNGDAEALVQEAHGLKGALGLLHAAPAHQAARRLEEMGRNNALEDVPDALDDLRRELNRLRPALREMVEEQAEEG